MKEIIELEEKINFLENLGEDVKTKKEAVRDAINLHNKLLKQMEDKEQLEKLKILKGKLEKIRAKFSNSNVAIKLGSESKTPNINFDPSTNKEHENIVELIGQKRDLDAVSALNKLIKKSPAINFNYIDFKVEGLDTVLCFAARCGCKQTILWLLNKGADVNFPGIDNTYPLHYAAKSGNQNLFELLMSHGAKIDVQDIHGNLPLMVAIDNTHFSLAEVILSKYKPDLEKVDYLGHTPIFYAVFHKSLKLVEKLLQLGAKHDHKNKYGQTPLSIIQDLAIQEQGTDSDILLTSNINSETRAIFKLLAEINSKTLHIQAPIGVGTMQEKFMVFPCK